MTDRELIEICAKWLGYKKDKTATLCSFDGNIEVLTDNGWRIFNPFNWNDLMTKVVPKLQGVLIVIHGDTFDLIKEPKGMRGRFPDDFPRTILELVAELHEKESQND